MVGRPFYDPIGTGGVTQLLNQSPIVGDPEPVLQLAATQYLTTGDLTTGESGEAGGLASMAIEMWFVTSTSTPAGGDYMAYGPVADAGFRQWELDLGSSGLVTFKVRSAAASNISATATAALAPTTWYHIVGTVVQGSSVNLYINGVLAATSAWNDSIRLSVFTAGSADMRLGDATGAGIYTYADVAFYRQALSATRVAAHYTAGISRGFAQSDSGARVSAVLDSVSSHAVRRIGAGARSVTPRYMSGQAPLDMLKEAVHGEAVDAAFFTASDGSLVFLDSAHRSSSPYSTVQATFGDATGELGYVEVNLDYSESFLVNEVTVTAEGTAQIAGQAQTSRDTTSISRYFKRPLSLAGLPVISDAAAATVASAMLAKYKDPMQRITGISFTTTDVDVAEALFRRELMDKITVKRTPPGGGARISQDLYIQKIEISGQNDGGPWAVRWGVSPL